MSKLLDYAVPVSSEFKKEKMKLIKNFKKIPSIPPNKSRKPAARKRIKNLEFSLTIPKDKTMSCIQLKQNDTGLKEGQFKKKENGNYYLNKKRERNNENCLSSCMICNWEFPPEMIDKEKMLHVNACADGNGEKDKANYLLSKARALLESELMESYSQCFKCPFCDKSLNSSKQMHVQMCAKRYLSSCETDTTLTNK